MSKSFTLAELAVVFGIIAIFLGLVYPRIPFVSQERSKSDARKIISLLSNTLRESLRNKRSIKITLLKRERELKFLRCVPVQYEDEKWREKEKQIEKLQSELGFVVPFRFEKISVCEWKEFSKKKISSEITSVFVEGQETFGNEVEIVFEGMRIPFVEIELDKKIWVILNPYIFRVFSDAKPAHKI